MIIINIKFKLLSEFIDCFSEGVSRIGGRREQDGTVDFLFIFLLSITCDCSE